MNFTSVADITVKTGDTSPFVEQTLLDFEGNPVDINAATVRFIMREFDVPDAVDVYLDEAASNDQAGAETTGHVHYEWQDGDTDFEGAYFAEWEVTFASGEVETFPNGTHIKVWIGDDLGGLVS